MRTRLLFACLVIGTLVITSAGNAFVDTPAGEKDKKESRSKSKKFGWLGVSIQDVTPRFARENGLKIKEGAYVNDVVRHSPADSAGLDEEDVIVEFNGKKIETAADLSDAVRETAPGTKVVIVYHREGKNTSVTAALGRNRMRTPFALSAPRAPVMMVNLFGRSIEGMELMALNKQLAAYFEVPEGNGVLVKEVEEDENAEKAGIKAGDVIIKVGDESVSDLDDVYEGISDAEEGEKVKIELIRKGKKSTVTMEISEDDYGNNKIWPHHSPEMFDFHVQPHLERLQRDLEIKMRDIPRKLRDKEVIGTMRKVRLV